MKYYLIAGEASGDLHGSNLIGALKSLDPDGIFRVWGGDKMKSAGATLVKHYKDHAIMGFFPVLRKIGTILRNFREVTMDILQFKPDALILIDYSGFNLRVAKRVTHLGFKIFYYISPQVWAWRKYRVHDIIKSVDKMYCVLPFVKEFYKKYNFDVSYFGHPLLDAIAEYKKQVPWSKSQFYKNFQLVDKPIIALLPGSRKQEIEIQLPVMLKATQNFSGYQIIIAGAPSIEEPFYKSITKDLPVPVIFNRTYTLLSFSHAAVVTSGTATLETALLKIPEVVCYRAGALSAMIVKKLVDIKYISLVNLIMDEVVVKELIQNDMNVTNLTRELHQLLEDTTYRKVMLEKMEVLHAKLGGPGTSLRVARDMSSLLKP